MKKMGQEMGEDLGDDLDAAVDEALADDGETAAGRDAGTGDRGGADDRNCRRS